MLNVSRQYKRIMKTPIRPRSYASVSLGVINQSAQGDAKVTSEIAFWSSGNIFIENPSPAVYSTFEQNFMKCDGSQLILPDLEQYKTNGVISANILEPITISFDSRFAIKGLTIDFGESYPTEFTITTDDTEEPTHTYTLNEPVFTTEDVIGEVTYITITPVTMLGGQQRLRINSMDMGIGLNFTNVVIENISDDAYTSPLATDSSYRDIRLSIFDQEGKFNVDNEDSFMSFLQPMQIMKLSEGIELEDGTIEWKQTATVYLKDWKSTRGKVSFTATDRLSRITGDYTGSPDIETRTAYAEFVRIFTAMGLGSDEYDIDSFLRNVTMSCPMPRGAYSDCLQLLASANRCTLSEDENGLIRIKPNFFTVLNPENFIVTSDDKTPWSEPHNIFYDLGEEYGDFSFNSIKASGDTFILPENSDYIDTNYVSQSIADSEGEFEEDPSVLLEFPATFSYFGVLITFGDVVPREFTINIYSDNTLLNSYLIENPEHETYVNEGFNNFNKFEIVVNKTEPNARVLINRVNFGGASDYRLTNEVMYDIPAGTMESKIKELWVKIYTYRNDGEGHAQEASDAVYCVKTLSAEGDVKYYENPLITTREQADLVGEWLSSYFMNNVQYEVDYRGDFRLQPQDIISVETEFTDNLQVSILKHSLSFNGALSGKLTLRRARKSESIGTRYVTLPGNPDASVIASQVSCNPEVTGLEATNVEDSLAEVDTKKLSLTGGEITGQITKNGGGGWISDRDNVAVKGISHGQHPGYSYNPVVGQKTTAGHWSMGNLSGEEDLIFNYTKDTDYPNSNVGHPAYLKLPKQYGQTIAYLGDCAKSPYGIGLQDMSSGYVMFTINSYTSWMLSFECVIYQSYENYHFRVSGYNYSTTGKWYTPLAHKICGNSTTVYFGHTSNNHLYVAIPRGSYVGAGVFNIVNGYQSIETDSSWDTLITISTVSSSLLPGTIDAQVSI